MTLNWRKLSSKYLLRNTRFQRIVYQYIRSVESHLSNTFPITIKNEIFIESYFYKIFHWLITDAMLAQNDNDRLEALNDLLKILSIKQQWDIITLKQLTQKHYLHTLWKHCEITSNTEVKDRILSLFILFEEQYIGKSIMRTCKPDANKIIFNMLNKETLDINISGKIFVILSFICRGSTKLKHILINQGILSILSKSILKCNAMKQDERLLKTWQNASILIYLLCDSISLSRNNEMIEEILQILLISLSKMCELYCDVMKHERIEIKCIIAYILKNIVSSFNRMNRDDENMIDLLMQRLMREKMLLTKIINILLLQSYHKLKHVTIEFFNIIYCSGSKINIDHCLNSGIVEQYITMFRKDYQLDKFETANLLLSFSNLLVSHNEHRLLILNTPEILEIIINHLHNKN